MAVSGLHSKEVVELDSGMGLPPPPRWWGLVDPPVVKGLREDEHGVGGAKRVTPAALDTAVPSGR